MLQDVVPETLDDVLALDERDADALGGELLGDLSILAGDGDGAEDVPSLEANALDSPDAEQLAVEWLSAAVGADQADREEDVDVDAREPAAADDSHDVHSYVTRHSPPTDDSEFDAYLLRGEHLSDFGHDFDSLVVERTEGVVSVDPSLESDLDYHQDFSLPQDFNPRTVAALARVVAPAMEELEAAVEARLVELSLPAGSVALDAMLATDPLSRRQCVDEGYVPFPGIGARIPAVLAELGDSERDALCVRLVLRDSGDTCNELFRENFALAVDDPGASLAAPAVGSFPSGLDLDIGGVGASGEFAVDVEPANDAGPAAASPVTGLETAAEDTSAAEREDIDGAWLDLSSVEEDDSAMLDLLSSAAASADGDPDLPDPLSATEDYDDSEMLSLLSMAAQEDDTDAQAPPAEMAAEFSALAPVDADADADAEALEMAAEDRDRDIAHAAGDEVIDVDGGESGDSDETAVPDIFSAEELDDWDAELAPGTDAADVEALLRSLGGEESDIGEICGVAVDEFDGGDDLAMEPLEQAVPVAVEASALGLARQPGAVDDEQSPAPAESGLAWCIPDNIRFNYTSRSGTEVFRDFLDAFLEEGAVELEKLEDAIGAWEQDFDSPAGTDVVPRVLHTLKGIAKGVGLQRYGTLIHNFETLLAALARPAEGGEADYFRIVNAWLDAAVQGFEHIQDTQSDVASELPQAEGLVEPVPAGGAGAADAALAVEARGDVSEDAPAVPVRAQERQQDKRLADEGAKVLAAQQTIRMTSEALDNLLNLSNQAQQLGVRASQSTFKSKRAGAELLARLSSVRSHITKIADRALQNVTARGGRDQSELDALEMDQYSELQEAASILREGIEDLDDLIHLANRQSASAESLLKQQASVITSLGSAIRDARVVPVARLMPGLRRIVRTVGADLGKAVNFRVLNEIGKLDRDSHVCCQIILEHMVRNALDHGIEAPEQRRAAGKPETGLVTIDVSKDGSDYLIRLSDDGRGMDPAALREAALERGLDVDVGALGDREALRLIFHKGFSTAARLSEISGRGVGMDIVLSELQQIGGDIDIDSTPGQGTTFTVRVPSNVNVNGALLVAAGDTSYAIPLDGLIAVEHIATNDFFRAVSEGERLCIYDLDCEPAYLATLCSGAKLPDPDSWGDTVPVILAGSEERYMAIAVDDVAEALELVIRSMGAQFSQVPGVAGGATTADGQAIVALDLNALVRNLAASQLSAVPFEREKSERLLVLVVDDSRTQRMVATSQFDTLGVETVTAENGLVAIDMLNATHRLPDVVLLDVEMPVKDGIQTLREIRKSERYKHLPVIMVTSRTGPKHRALAQEAGCNGYMGKPFNFPVLVEQIVQLTGHELQIN
ncbi:response regulator [Parahaliea mediterranea]